MVVGGGGETAEAGPGSIQQTPAAGETVPRRYPASGTGIAAAFGQGRGPAHIHRDRTGRHTPPDPRSGTPAHRRSCTPPDRKRGASTTTERTTPQRPAGSP